MDTLCLLQWDELCLRKGCEKKQLIKLESWEILHQSSESDWPISRLLCCSSTFQYRIGVLGTSTQGNGSVGTVLWCWKRINNHSNAYWTELDCLLETRLWCIQYPAGWKRGGGGSLKRHRLRLDHKASDEAFPLDLSEQSECEQQFIWAQTVWDVLMVNITKCEREMNKYALKLKDLLIYDGIKTQNHLQLFLFNLFITKNSLFCFGRIHKAPPPVLGRGQMGSVLQRRRCLTLKLLLKADFTWQRWMWGCVQVLESSRMEPDWTNWLNLISNN